VWMFMCPDLIAPNGSKAYGLDLVSRVCDGCFDLHHQSTDQRSRVGSNSSRTVKIRWPGSHRTQHRPRAATASSQQGTPATTPSCAVEPHEPFPTRLFEVQNKVNRMGEVLPRDSEPVSQTTVRSASATQRNSNEQFTGLLRTSGPDFPRSRSSSPGKSARPLIASGAAVQALGHGGGRFAPHGDERTR